jgi:hypothetical protein
MKTTLQNTKTSSVSAFNKVIKFFLIALCLQTALQQSYAASSYNSSKCLSFNGSNSGVTFANNDLSLGSSDKMTVTAWVMWNNTTNAGAWANMVTLNSNTGSGDVGQFWLQHASDNSKFEFAVQNSSGTRVFVQSATTVSTGVWYHLAGVYDGSYIYLYVNGVMESRTSLTGNIATYQSGYQLAMGQWANFSGSYRRFNGNMDEVSIWNTALTQSQIRAQMCKKLIGNESGLVGYWKMNETSGTSIADATSNNRTGSTSNTSIVTSGAPVGDAAVNTFGGTSLALGHPDYTDSMVVNGFSKTPTGIIIYRIDSTPNNTNRSGGSTSMGKSHYFGVFIINSTSLTYKAILYYKGYPGISDNSQLGMLGRPDNANAWNDSTYTLSTSKNTLTKTGVAGRKEFIIVSTDAAPLPITLISFTATAKINEVLLAWTSANEINNDHYTLERSADGLTFEKVAEEQGAFNSSTLNNYSYTDHQPLSGTSFYRLSQTDLNGNTEIFKSVQVYIKGSEQIFELQSVFPNSFSETVNVSLKCGNSQQLISKIYSVDGKEQTSESFVASAGSQVFNIESSNALANGTYFLVISNTLGQSVKTTIIKRRDF